MLSYVQLLPWTFIFSPSWEIFNLYAMISSSVSMIEVNNIVLHSSVASAVSCWVYNSETNLVHSVITYGPKNKKSNCQNNLFSIALTVHFYYSCAYFWIFLKYFYNRLWITVILEWVALHLPGGLRNFKVAIRLDNFLMTNFWAKFF